MLMCFAINSCEATKNFEHNDRVHCSWQLFAIIVRVILYLCIARYSGEIILICKGERYFFLSSNDSIFASVSWTEIAKGKRF